MKSYEREALLKSFFTFFALQLILLFVIMIQGHKQGIQMIDEQIYTEFKICSFDLKCEGITLDFVEKTSSIIPLQLYKDDGIYSYFPVPTADGFLLKTALDEKSYIQRKETLKNSLIKKFLLYSFLIALLSFIFSLYALYPLKKALHINDEFIKDILHDINTPLSSMIVNFKLFKKEIGENRKIARMEHSVATILSLQDNLQAFLNHSSLQEETFALDVLIKERIAYFQPLYPSISFESTLKKSSKIKTNKEAIQRVLDNLISNACKYSPKDATIKIYMKDDTLHIADNGSGIKDIKKVFDRYYKESARGLGIGMHVVKKICDALGIDISLESTLGVGTTIMIDIRKVILR